MVNKYNIEEVLENTKFTNDHDVELNFLEKRVGIGYKFSYSKCSEKLVKRDLKIKRLKAQDKNKNMNEISSEETEPITKMDVIRKRFKRC